MHPWRERWERVSIGLVCNLACMAIDDRSIVRARCGSAVHVLQGRDEQSFPRIGVRVARPDAPRREMHFGGKFEQHRRIVSTCAGVYSFPASANRHSACSWT